ncbi:probable inactive receptor kinase At5g67200 [Cajanus cajan]|uniref:Inactive receptor kinase At5g67200 family n=1 Tax=Cajanus cajan TaxID=3821 RepID=A0A151RCG3_CAJCA|nr:probable inactive receptor kinase At5g67200 [Cajanus cajan]KYP40221.1 putative inactive receptor kinase At5g67200 family [Cajanus cajan]
MHRLTLTLTLTLLLLLLPRLGSSAPAALPSDAVSLLSFKQQADQDNRLLYALNERYDYCSWQGVKCAQGRVVRFVAQSMGLRGPFPPDTLTKLDQLRVLSLRNNSLFGPIPDLSPLTNLKSLFLDRNAFSGAFPPSLLLLHRLITLSLSANNLSGPLPPQLPLLPRLVALRLDSNNFSGTLPSLNQTSLKLLNVSHNNLTGPIPVTSALAKLNPQSFSQNPGLCGEILHKQCPRSHFFASTAPLSQSEQSQGIVVVPSNTAKPKHHPRTGLVLGLIVAVVLVAALSLTVISLVRRRRAVVVVVERAVSGEGESQREVKVRKMEEAHRSGSLVFCYGEVQQYTLEMLMRASAELLGRGSVGTTYKAVMDSRLIVTVKRLDGGNSEGSDGELFERHMEVVGRLRHPNLVPLRAYFQAKGERLVIYDYQPNGSLFNLVHGSRSARAKPLHWTSCLKIAEDVAHGLAYIHQVSSLIHGNLKSSNVLLGVDFEACITDYCLAFFADPSFPEDPDSAAYKAPEARKSGRRATSKSDVYSFGVLLLELLTGKRPSQHPFLAPTDLQDWVRAMRDDDVSEDNRLEMLTEVASICSATSPEQRPAMWQVLKMIQEIKDSVTMKDAALSGLS